jgi:hypothetical protein
MKANFLKKNYWLDGFCHPINDCSGCSPVWHVRGLQGSALLASPSALARPDYLIALCFCFFHLKNRNTISWPWYLNWIIAYWCFSAQVPCHLITSALRSCLTLLCDLPLPRLWRRQLSPSGLNKVKCKGSFGPSGMADCRSLNGTCAGHSDTKWGGRQLGVSAWGQIVILAL